MTKEEIKLPTEEYTYEFHGTEFSIKPVSQETRELLELYGIDIEAALTSILKKEIDKEIAKTKTIELSTLSLEGRVEKMKSMLDTDIPDFLRKDILANLLTVMEKKIRKDYCE